MILDTRLIEEVGYLDKDYIYLGNFINRYQILMQR